MLKTLLIVDDSPIARRMLKALIPNLESYTVHEASNGQAGFETYAAVRPDLTFMDLTMPIMDGLQATEAIRKHDPNAVVVVVTADVQMKNFFRALELGALTILRKPASPEAVAEVLAKAEEEFHSKKRGSPPAAEPSPTRPAPARPAHPTFRVICRFEGLDCTADVESITRQGLRISTDTPFEIGDELLACALQETPGFNQDEISCQVTWAGDCDDSGLHQADLRFDEPDEVVAHSWVGYFLRATQATTPDPRRPFRRLAKAVGVDIALKQGVMRGKAIGMSPSGVTVHTAEALPFGQNLVVGLGPHATLGLLHLPGRVTNSRLDPTTAGHFISGVSFSPLNRDQSNLLDSYLDLLAPEP